MKTTPLTGLWHKRAPPSRSTIPRQVYDLSICTPTYLVPYKVVSHLRCVRGAWNRFKGLRPP